MIRVSNSLDLDQARQNLGSSLGPNCLQKLSADDTRLVSLSPGLEVIKLEYSLRLKIKRNDWLLADMCPQAPNHCALFCV